MTKDNLIELYNQYKILHNKPPSRDQLCQGTNLKRIINKVFGSYSELQRICGDRSQKFIPTEVVCTGCLKSFITKFEGNTFCSKSCANKVVKIKHGKYSNFTPLIKTCSECGVEMVNTSSSFCSIKCKMTNSFKSTKMEDLIIRGKQNRYDTIRSRARNFSKFFHKPLCENCGYDKHYEVCHIKPVSSFDITSTLYEVNNPNNLIHLCSNCHWELDNGLLTLDQIRN